MSYAGLNKKVFDKMPKQEVELSKMEVELANVKDLPKKLKSVLDWQKKLDKSLPALEKLQSDVKEQKGMLDLMAKEAESLLSEVEKKSKDLGIDPTTLDGFKQLQIEVSNSRSEYLK